MARNMITDALFPSTIADKTVETSTEDSDSDDEKEKISSPPSKLKFRCSSYRNKITGKNLFTIDTSGSDSVKKKSVKAARGINQNLPSQVANDVLLDETTKMLLAKSVIHSGFEKTLGEGYIPLTAGELKRRRKANRERTKGNNWFNLPATELTEERRRDLELLQMRDAIDEKARYRKSDRKVLPKYFETGTIIESKADFYSSRIPKKERKRTIAEELIADYEFMAKQSRKYQELKEIEARTRKGSFQRSSYPRRNRIQKRKRFSHN